MGLFVRPLVKLFFDGLLSRLDDISDYFESKLLRCSILVLLLPLLQSLGRGYNVTSHSTSSHFEINNGSIFSTFHHIFEPQVIVKFLFFILYYIYGYEFRYKSPQFNILFIYFYLLLLLLIFFIHGTLY